jgi:trehalose-phosphatase
MTLDAALRSLSVTPLLVAMDFDGTLSEIVDEPHLARPVDGAVDALGDLAEAPGVRVAVVSGRPISDLERLLAPPVGVVLIGEHGAVRQGEVPSRPERFDEVLAALEAIAHAVPGAWVERKATSLVFHTRAVDPDMESSVVDRVRQALSTVGHDLFHLGKKVVDVGFVSTSKGVAISELRKPFEVVVFAGDDVTDETVFRSLRAGDLGIKVGDGPTVAEFRVDGPPAVVGVLESLAAIRTAI